MTLVKTLFLGLVLSLSSLASAETSCPAAKHKLELCGTLTVTDYMGVPGSSPKFWIVSNEQWVRLGSYEGDWGKLAMAAYKHESLCLYSDQEAIQDEIAIAELCR
jgi:hypothetical protein